MLLDKKKEKHFLHREKYLLSTNKNFFPHKTFVVSFYNSQGEEGDIKKY